MLPDNAGSSTTKNPAFRRGFYFCSFYSVPPRVGLEPTTYRLTAGRSTIELSGKNLFFARLILAIHLFY